MPGAAPGRQLTAEATSLRVLAACLALSVFTATVASHMSPPLWFACADSRLGAVPTSAARGSPATTTVLPSAHDPPRAATPATIWPQDHPVRIDGGLPAHLGADDDVQARRLRGEPEAAAGARAAPLPVRRSALSSSATGATANVTSLRRARRLSCGSRRRRGRWPRGAAKSSIDGTRTS
jgi:hypothetical protein